MNFKIALENYIKNYPNLLPIDIIKFIYQASFGMEHLISDIEKAKQFFDLEFENTLASDCPLYEELNEFYVKVNLGAWKTENLKKEWLFNMFTNSAKAQNVSSFEDNLQEAVDVIKKSNLSFTINEWKNEIDSYMKSGILPVHHSETFKNNYNPSYRVIDKKYLITFPILKRITKGNFVISIDGKAASGKTYLSSLLEDILDIQSIKMDHFFLPLNLRTKERFNEIGGNVDYDRFILEVLPHLKDKKSFSYNIFDCSIMKQNGKKEIKGNDIKLIEGTYSNHIKFNEYADLKVFLDIDKETQEKRILARNGEKMLERFKNEWIPLEEKYFSSLDTRGNKWVKITNI